MNKSRPEKNKEVAIKHLEIGNLINAPQMELYDNYPGAKYVVFDGDGYMTAAHPDITKNVICWTPFKFVADIIVANLKKAGWKYNTACTEELTPDLAKKFRSLRWVMNSEAGFYYMSITHKDTVVEIVPKSPVIESLKDK